MACQAVPTRRQHNHKNHKIQHSPEPKPYPPAGAAHPVLELATAHGREQEYAEADSADLRPQVLPVAEPEQQQQQRRPVAQLQPSSQDTLGKAAARTHPSLPQPLSVSSNNLLGDVLRFRHQNLKVHRQPQKPPGKRDKTPRWACRQGDAELVVLVVLVLEQRPVVGKACQTKKGSIHPNGIGSWLQRQTDEVEARTRSHQVPSKLNQGQERAWNAARSSTDPTCPSTVDSAAHYQNWGSPNPVRT